MSRIDGAVKNFPPECPCLITQPHAAASSWPRQLGGSACVKPPPIPAAPLRSADSAESNGEGTVADSGGVVRS